MAESVPYLTFQPPPRPHLQAFNRSLPASQQPPSVPRTFLDALTVRESVFVSERKAVPLKHHTDTDDARSCHWTLYLPPSPLSLTPNPKPIGTIRLVPSPHSPHPEPGSNYDVPALEQVASQSAEEVFFAAGPIWAVDKKTEFHDGEEVYVKLGRLAVLKEERGRRVADLLIQGALGWARGNRGDVSGMCGGREWKGLVCVHAQEGAVGVWRRNGFVVDGGMGEWFEAGLRHVGMWVRL